MKISVITACFNAEDTIADCAASVVSQTGVELEYIVVDGNSTDSTLARLEPYKGKITKLVSEKDQGLYDALNKGIALASGQVVAILHADDLYSDNRVLERVSQTFNEMGVEAVYGDLLYVNRENTALVIRNWKSGAYRREAFERGWMPPHPAFFIKKEAYEKHGLFDLRLKSAADYELMLRMLYRHGLKAAYLPGVLVRMRVGGKSNVTLANRLKANNEDRMAWELNGMRPPRFLKLLKPLRKVGQFFR